MPRIRIDAGFDKSFKKPSGLHQQAVIRALEKFQANARHPSLNFEPIGNEGYHSIRATRGYRVMLRRESDASGELFAVVDVGRHDIYRRY